MPEDYNPLDPFVCDEFDEGGFRRFHGHGERRQMQRFRGKRATPPDGTDSPLLIFVSMVKPGATDPFCFRLGSRTADREVMEGGMELLRVGLQQLGLGSKTEVGYGRFKPVQLPTYRAHVQKQVGGDPVVIFEGMIGELPGRLLPSDGVSAPLSPERLATILSLAQPRLECVVLNACKSIQSARALLPYVNVVVGTTATISDLSGREFSRGFYRALFAGHSYAEAFEHGRKEVEGHEPSKFKLLPAED